MQIERVRAHVVRLPADEPLADSKPHPPGATRDIVAVKVATRDGIEGVGVTCFGAAMTGALKVAVEELGALIVGDDPRLTERIADKLRQAAGTSGPGGLFTLALSAIDTALWDIRGKVLGMPVAKLLGGFRDRAPAYASGALMRTLSLDEVVTAAGRLAERGWTAMKTQLALPGGTIAEVEVERIRRVREAIGPDIRLMCDINQRWTVFEAVSIGERIEPYHLHWLEERHRLRRLCRPRPRGRQAQDADRRRRVRLRLVALPPDAGGALGRHRHDRSGARRRHHAVDEGGRHGGSLQFAGRLAFDPRGSRAPHRRHPQRPHRRVHAVDADAVRQPAAAGEQRDDGAR